MERVNGTVDFVKDKRSVRHIAATYAIDGVATRRDGAYAPETSLHPLAIDPHQRVPRTITRR